jgi:lipopolysaccharide transport system ATP-binding protein
LSAAKFWAWWGHNGAGKSTLLQILSGTLSPSTGDLQVNGRVAALLELGAGFNPEFTGRENLLLNGPLLGLSRAQLAERLQDIIDFSGIGDFIEQPVKTYSSGMFVRLAFSLATSVDPDILVIDEALSVGDGEFSRKSFDRILALRDAGTTILFCSHSMYQIESLCSRALWLDHGRARQFGRPAVVATAYQEHLDTLAAPGRRGSPGRPAGGDVARACAPEDPADQLRWTRRQPCACCVGPKPRGHHAGFRVRPGAGFAERSGHPQRPRRQDPGQLGHLD